MLDESRDIDDILIGPGGFFVIYRLLRYDHKTFGTRPELVEVPLTV
jgi:hypothetical protein